MSEYGSNYVPVEANSVMPMAEGGSGQGGYNVTGYYVNWTDAGITAKDWSTVISMPNSPFAGMTVESIAEQINNVGNFDNLFANWGNAHGPSQEMEFLNAATAYYGFTDQNGCIGDQLY